MKKIKYIITVTMLTLMLSLQFGCSNEGGNGVDDYLDRFEKVVETYEEKVKSGSMSISDIQDISEAQINLSDEEKQIEEVWTDTQRDRFQDLTSRLSKAVTKMSTSKFEFK